MASDAQHRTGIDRENRSFAKCLEAVDKMTLKNFNYPFKEFQKSHFGNRREIGMLAQDAISVLPSSRPYRSLVSENDCDGASGKR